MTVLTGRDYTAGTHLPEEDYQKLQGFKAEISDDEAKAYINREFGFEFSRIRIIREVQTYIVNNHRLYPDKTYKRNPLYDATDYNYIRFNCMAWQWEVIDGQIYPYED